MKSAAKIEVYTPIKYSDLEYRLFNLISSKKLLFQMSVGKESVLVKLGFDGTYFPSEVLNKNYDAHLAFDIEDELWQISFQKTRFLYELLEKADGSTLFTDSPPDSLPDNVLWAVIEAFLSQSLSRIEALTGKHVKITDPDNSSSLRCFNLPFEIIFDDKKDDKNGSKKFAHGILKIPLNSVCVNLIENLLSDFPVKLWREEILFNLNKTLFFEAGRMKLKFFQLNAIEIGDVLIPENWYLNENKLAMRVSTDLFFCDYNEQTMSMTVIAKKSVMDDFSDMATKKYKAGNSKAGNSKTGNTKIGNDKSDKLGKKDMTKENKVSDIEQNDEQDVMKGTKNLDLNLVFEVGSTIMTIDQIGKIAKGQVINLPHKFDDGVPVDIKVNSQLIAQGKIVCVGDDIGVQITKIGDE